MNLLELWVDSLDFFVGVHLYVSNPRKGFTNSCPQELSSASKSHSYQLLPVTASRPSLSENNRLSSKVLHITEY